MRIIEIEFADTFFKRLLGLIGRKNLEPAHALMIAPCNAIHMMFMRFAIDAVFIDQSFCIKKIFRNLKPWRGFAFCQGAWAVLELNAGEALRLNLVVGQCLKDIL